MRELPQPKPDDFAGSLGEGASGETVHFAIQPETVPLCQKPSVKFINDRTTGRFRGIAFVEMEDDAAAAKAIAELDGAEFFGRQMVVKEARPPKY